MKKPKGTGLKFVPIDDLTLIPRYLIEQVRDLNATPERFYSLAPLIVNNPLGVFGVFCDQENIIKGFMWLVISPLDRSLHCKALSIDKKYQGSTILKEAANILKKVKKRNGCTKITFITSRSKAMEKAGFKKTKRCVMEVE